MITPSKRLRDFRQGRKIETVIDAVNADLKDLIDYDERFHPIKNIDAAARMLCDHYQRIHSWHEALERYAGRRTYDSKVMSYVERMASRRFMDNVRLDFEARNQEIKVNGKLFDFDAYLATFHRLNRNYGLDAYLKLKRRPVS